MNFYKNDSCPNVDADEEKKTNTNTGDKILRRVKLDKIRNRYKNSAKYL